MDRLKRNEHMPVFVSFFRHGVCMFLAFDFGFIQSSMFTPFLNAPLFSFSFLKSKLVRKLIVSLIHHILLKRLAVAEIVLTKIICSGARLLFKQCVIIA